VFLSGLTLFTAASLACGFAGSQEILVAARFIQGIGGALTSAVILGMIVTMFPSRGSRPRRSASTASWPPPAPRSACWPAAR
jgi:MFS family permease